MVQHGPIVESAGARAQERKKERADASSKHHAHAVARHTVHEAAVGKRHTEENDAAVINKRCQSGNRELTAQVKKGDDARPHQEKDLGRQNNAHEERQSRIAGRIESWRHYVRQRLREKHAKGRYSHGAYGHPRQDAGIETPPVRFILTEPFRKQRDQCYGHKTAGKQVVDDVRHNECRKIHIRLAAGTKLPGDNLVADKAHKSGQKRAHCQNNSSHAHTLRLRKYAHVCSALSLFFPAAEDGAHDILDFGRPDRGI